MMKITGVIKSEGSVKGNIRSGRCIQGEVTSEGQLEGIVLIGVETDVPIYEGDYDVTPALNLQVMETQFMRMKDNVSVRSIPYQEVSNPSGGKTVTIG